MTVLDILARGALVGCALATRVPAQSVIASPIVVNAMSGSSLTIRGSTTIGANWHCASTGVESNMAVAARAAHEDRSMLPEVRGVTIHLPVAALRCQSGGMERAMRRALKADRDTAAQSIVGRFEIADDVPVA